MNNYLIRISGIVQGVGFRPFVYRVANELGLFGEVSNDSFGVVIEVVASKEDLDRFLDTLQNKTPPLAKIDDIKVLQTKPKEYKSFSIIQSSNSKEIKTLIPPDLSICKDCQRELFDPKNRRYLYPFITCTNCGVRYSIIKFLPYDRKNTSMSEFKMCKKCQMEYENPNDRRYHAQPIGCFECGPKLNMSIDEAVTLLKDGKILAIKGVGGYHLVCDATNKEAIKKLRERKNRPKKPFAVMVRDIKEAKNLAYINQKEEELLTSSKRPIVLLRSKKVLDESIAPNISKIGLFLPYTPLHLLLLNSLKRPIVATSANISKEPICSDLNSLKRLKGVYDVVLDHNREIVNSCDDSVVMVVKNQTIILRRARGYAPNSIKLPFKLDKNILALGANQKSTVAIGFDNEAILSPHIGDLDTIESLNHFNKHIESIKRVYEFKPDLIACDKHPNYESSKYAKANFKNIKAIQHHYAHILSVMAEKKIKDRVLGVAFDGTGLGDDGTLWGGEFLICDLNRYERVAHIREFKLLGGDRAIKEPRRVALSLLFDLFGKRVFDMQNPTTKAFSKEELENFYKMWQKGLNAPLSSSCGRIFDGVASLMGVVQVISYEGESGMRMEEFYDKSIKVSYDFEVVDKKIDLLPMVKEMLKDEPRVAISKFFNTLVEVLADIRGRYDLPLLVSGGVFQNRVLLELLIERFPDVIIPNEIPPNDGGVALGQLMASSR